MVFTKLEVPALTSDEPMATFPAGVSAQGELVHRTATGYRSITGKRFEKLAGKFVSVVELSMRPV